MNLESRIEKLEMRRRERETADEPLYLQRSDRDDDGNVTACERLVWPPISKQGGMTPAEVMASVKREPFARSTCCYPECEHRATCRAAGELTRWGSRS